MTNFEKITKGAITQNNARRFGDTRLQWRITAQKFAECEEKGRTPIRIVNVNTTAHLPRYRIDYVKNGQYRYAFGDNGLTSHGADNWIILYRAEYGTTSERAETPEWIQVLINQGISLSSLRDNLTHHGYTSRNIIAAARRGATKVNSDLAHNMRRAAVRHLLTDYDDRDKSGMDDYQVRELRRSMTPLV